MMMKHILLVLMAFATFGNAGAQNKKEMEKTYYIVRHAEKDTGSDPGLSAAGLQRSADLYQALKNKKIDLILVTQFRRTAMTADTLRLKQNIPVVQYKADASGEGLMASLNEKGQVANRVLIIGHSNTIPAIIRKLGVENYTVKELDESDYNHMFVVTVKKGKAKVKITTYGADSIGTSSPGSPNMLQ